MRIRILQPSVGVVDGVSLGHLIPGLVYDLKPITANYLIAQGCAERLPASEPAIVTRPDNPTFFSPLSGGVRVTGITLPRDEAADKPRARRKKSTKTHGT